MYVTLFRNCPEGGMSFEQQSLDELEMTALEYGPGNMSFIEEKIFSLIDVLSMPMELRDGKDYGVYEIVEECELDSYLVIASDEVDAAIRFYNYFKERN